LGFEHFAQETQIGWGVVYHENIRLWHSGIHLSIRVWRGPSAGETPTRGCVFVREAENRPGNRFRLFFHPICLGSFGNSLRAADKTPVAQAWGGLAREKIAISRNIM
jgi:hypothetical protein